MADSFMAQHGLQMLRNGYAVVPIMPGSKVPGSYYAPPGIGWAAMKNWSSFGPEPASERLVAKWCAFPDAGVGVVCGNVVAVDIDLMDADAADAVEAVFRRVLGETPLRRVGRAPKRLLVYATDKPFTKMSVGPIELLCQGQQFVAHAVHPDTGLPYGWLGLTPSEVLVADLPVVTQELASVALAEAVEVLPPELRVKARAAAEARPARSAEAGGGGTSPIGLTAHRDAVIDAAAALKNADLVWDDWARRGMMIFAASSGADWAQEVFHRFSAKSEKYDPARTSQKWNEFQRSPPTRVGAGSLFDQARRDGWNPPTELDFHMGLIDGSEDFGIDFEALLQGRGETRGG